MSDSRAKHAFVRDESTSKFTMLFVGTDSVSSVLYAVVFALCRMRVVFRCFCHVDLKLCFDDRSQG